MDWTQGYLERIRSDALRQPCLMLGLVGLALRPPSVEAAPSDMTNDDEPSELEAGLTPAEIYERTAKEKRRARWAEREREEPANERPSIIGEESK